MTAILPNSAVRPSLGEILALAAALAALGLGLAQLSAALLSPAASDAPPRLLAAALPGAAATSAAPERGPWPAMFGHPEPAPVAVPEDVVAPPADEPPPVEEEEDVWEDMDDDPGPLLDYALKGMIATGGNGWILVEIDGEELVYRVGDELPGGERILALTPEGALIEDPYGGPDVLLAPAEAEPAAGDWEEPQARIDAVDDYGDDDYDDGDYDDGDGGND